MDLNALVQLFKSLAKSAYKNRNDEEKWEGWADVYDDGENDEPSKVVLNGKFKAVSIGLEGLKFILDFQGEELKIEARPDVGRYNVFVNDVLDSEARVKIAPKGTFSHPLRVAIDIRPLTVDGDECRFNLRFRG